MFFVDYADCPSVQLHSDWSDYLQTMTAVQQPPHGGDAGLRWDTNNVDNENIDEFEDDESNSAKLFERSRIRALAGKQRAVVCSVGEYRPSVRLKLLNGCKVLTSWTSWSL